MEFHSWSILFEGKDSNCPSKDSSWNPRIDKYTGAHLYGPQVYGHPARMKWPGLDDYMVNFQYCDPAVQKSKMGPVMTQEITLTLITARRRPKFGTALCNSGVGAAARCSHWLKEGEPTATDRGSRGVMNFFGIGSITGSRSNYRATGISRSRCTKNWTNIRPFWPNRMQECGLLQHFPHVQMEFAFSSTFAMCSGLRYRIGITKSPKRMKIQIRIQIQAWICNTSTRERGSQAGRENWRRRALRSMQRYGGWEGYSLMLKQGH